jgi:hypothetical protein
MVVAYAARRITVSNNCIPGFDLRKAGYKLWKSIYQNVVSVV